VNEFLSFLFDKTRSKRKQFKVILTQNDCNTIPRKGCVGVENAYVYLKILNKDWEILKVFYDSRNIVTIDDSKEKNMFVMIKRAK
jgi:hypothetical protein